MVWKILLYSSVQLCLKLVCKSTTTRESIFFFWMLLMFCAPLPGAARSLHGGQGGELPGGRGLLPCCMKPAGCCFSDRCFWGCFFPDAPLSGTSCVSSSPPRSIYLPIKPVHFAPRLDLSPEPLPAAPSRRAGRRRPACGARNGHWGRVAGPPCHTRPEVGGGGAARAVPQPPLLAAFSLLRDGEPPLQPLDVKQEVAEQKAARSPWKRSRAMGGLGSSTPMAATASGEGSRVIL